MVLLSTCGDGLLFLVPLPKESPVSTSTSTSPPELRAAAQPRPRPLQPVFSPGSAAADHHRASWELTDKMTSDKRLVISARIIGAVLRDTPKLKVSCHLQNFPSFQCELLTSIISWDSRCVCVTLTDVHDICGLVWWHWSDCLQVFPRLQEISCKWKKLYW